MAKDEQENSPLSDIEIVDQVLGGDINAFEVLVVRYQPKIFGMARRYARRQDEVEDIVQTTFIKAFQKLYTYQRKAPFENWLTKMAILCCYDFLRKHQRNRELSFSALSGNEQEFLDKNLMASEEDKTELEENLALLNLALTQLSPASRLLIDLFEIQDKTVKEIAEMTGWSTGLVKVRAFRARSELKKVLQKILKEKNL